MLTQRQTQMVETLYAKGSTARKIANKLSLPLDDVKLAIDLITPVPAAPAAPEPAPEPEPEDETDGEEITIDLDRLDGEQIKQRIEAMYASALEVVALAMRKPKAVTQVQWNATQWVLNKAAAIQEMQKEKGGDTVVNQFHVSDKAGAAIERMMNDLTGNDWKEQLEASLTDMPETQ